ncbi:nicotinate-nucleotide adenylyltransferase [uncultured Veillonella sp.]|uniref:nicotinate-nucleotide adenylyltransferase n=1 Tax=uncultured Veillonella sp. TaxID=159268 RepID=UPI0026042306|nr:nicotinate-nucleotide adenylyltransferase [uncultured Veillonella sp.]
MTNTGRIGIFGGTFNPIHMGHLMIAELALEAYELERVIFVPSYHPPHKDSDVIAASYRYDMTAIAIRDNPRFTISDIEFKREGPSYTIDTVKYFHSIYGEDKEYYFIAGTDTIQDLPNWKYIDELLALCYFIGAIRPDGSETIDNIIEYFGDVGKKQIHRLLVPTMNLSATDLRARLRDNRSVRYMVPKAVVHYIKEHNIYRSKEV